MNQFTGTSVHDRLCIAAAITAILLLIFTATKIASQVYRIPRAKPTVTLEWHDPNPPEKVQGYNIYVNETSGQTILTAPDTTAVLQTPNIPDSASYYVKVLGVSGDESGPSNIIHIVLVDSAYIPDYPDTDIPLIQTVSQMRYSWVTKEPGIRSSYCYFNETNNTLYLNTIAAESKYGFVVRDIRINESATYRFQLIEPTALNGAVLKIRVNGTYYNLADNALVIALDPGIHNVLIESFNYKASFHGIAFTKATGNELLPVTMFKVKE